MPIEVSCSCGRRLKAPDKLLGKKAKCPDCGKILVIKKPDPVAKSDPKPVAPTPATTSSQIDAGGGSSRAVSPDESDGAYGLAGDDDDLTRHEIQIDFKQHLVLRSEAMIEVPNLNARTRLLP